MGTQATEIIATFTNEELGIAAYVAKVSRGFSVAIKDTDAGEFFPVCNIYQTEELAITKAKKAVS